MFLYIKTNILRGYGIFKNDFAHPREPATGAAGRRAAVIFQPGLILNMLRADTDDPHTHLHTGIVAQMLHN